MGPAPSNVALSSYRLVAGDNDLFGVFHIPPGRSNQSGKSSHLRFDENMPVPGGDIPLVITKGDVR